MSWIFKHPTIAVTFSKTLTATETLKLACTCRNAQVAPLLAYDDVLNAVHLSVVEWLDNARKAVISNNWATLVRLVRNILGELDAERRVILQTQRNAREFFQPASAKRAKLQ